MAVVRTEAVDVTPGAVPHPTVVVATLLQEHGTTGVQTHFNAVLRFLREQGGPADCVTPFSSSRALVYAALGTRRVIQRVSSPFGVWWYRHWHGKLLERALRHRLDRETAPVVVYAQCPVSAAAALRARRGRGNVRVVLAVHFNVSQAEEWADKGLLERGGSLYGRIRRFEESILPQVDGLVYVSEFMRRELEGRIRELRGVRSAVVPNFVDVPLEHQVVPRRDLVGVGTMEPRKNQAYLLAILHAAADAGHRYTLTLIGDGPDRPLLERSAVELGVAEQVEFLGYRRDSQSLIGEHRLLCHAARMDNFPLTILEAMARGIPVAAASVGGIPEMLRDGVEGVFWPLDDPEAAARILIGRLEDPAGLTALGAAARRRVRESFSTEAVAHRLAAFLYES